MGNEIDVERVLSRKDVIKLIGLAGAILLLSACDRKLNPIPTQLKPEISPIPNLTNTPSPTDTPTQTPEPTLTPTSTEIPIPLVPENVITSSLGLINVMPVKEEGTGDWVIDDMLGKVFWRWDNKTQMWQDERPLYWQCGRLIFMDQYPGESPYLPLYSDSVIEEVRTLPTGLRSDLPNLDETARIAKVRACLIDTNNNPGSYDTNITYIGKVVFFDMYGIAHEYKLGIGPLLINGKKTRMGFTFSGRRSAAELDKALVWLNEYFNYQKPYASRQIDFHLIIEDFVGTWPASDKINNYKDITLQLIEALRTGEGFPDTVPDDFFIWAYEFFCMPEFKPSDLNTP